MPARDPSDAMRRDNLVAVNAPALWVHRGQPPTMTTAHRHDDIEVNIVLRGKLEYLFGGSRLTVPAGQLAIFWAATPHRLIVATDADRTHTHGCWIHIPLDKALRWNLPENQIGKMLQMSALLAPTDCLPYDPNRLFTAWEQELDAADGDGLDGTNTAPALLEAQALLGRALRQTRPALVADEDENDPPRHSATLMAVTSMARFIVEHFREQLSLENIAAAAHLNRNYAATIFSRSLETTPGRYLTRCRVTEAQRLLITTDKSLAHIANEAGFSSQSSFYTHFTRHCGATPGAYRRCLR